MRLLLDSLDSPRARERPSSIQPCYPDSDLRPRNRAWWRVCRGIQMDGQECALFFSPSKLPPTLTTSRQNNHFDFQSQELGVFLFQGLFFGTAHKTGSCTVSCSKRRWLFSRRLNSSVFQWRPGLLSHFHICRRQPDTQESMQTQLSTACHQRYLSLLSAVHGSKTRHPNAPKWGHFFWFLFKVKIPKQHLTSG